MSSDPLVEHTGTICFTEGSVFGGPCAKFDQLGRVEAATKSEPQVVLVKGLSQFPDNRAECVIRASDGPCRTIHGYGSSGLALFSGIQRSI